VMASIAAAADEQSTGVAQINSAIEQLNQVTQQIAANAEESASAAQELDSQANSLHDTVGTFALASAGASAAPWSPGRSQPRSRRSAARELAMV
jgi:methyl-accepting chemotaxis protein